MDMILVPSSCRSRAVEAGVSRNRWSLGTRLTAACLAAALAVAGAWGFPWVPGALAQEGAPDVQPLEAADIATGVPELVLAGENGTLVAPGQAAPGQALGDRIFVVVGDVQSPGSYPWRDGMTVQSALDEAGGLLIGSAPGAPDDADAEIDRTKAREDLEVVSVAYYGVLARRARLVAERDELEAIPIPKELRRPDYDPTIEDIVLGEQQLFSSRKKMRQGEIELLEQQRELFENEIDGLRSQLAATREVGRLLKEERDLIKSLKDKGLVKGTQLLTVERSMFDQKADERRIGVEIIRARQDMNRLQADLNELENGHKSEILSAIQEENRNLARLKRELAGARERFKLQVRRSFESLNRVGAGYGGISITRQVDGSYQEIQARADLPLLPGDVVTVVGFHDTDSYLSIEDASGASPDF